MLREIDPTLQTVYAELIQRSLDRRFFTDFPAEGRFVRVKVKERDYFYFDTANGGQKKRRYVGPADDPDISARVSAHQSVKDDAIACRDMVKALIAVGLPRCDSFAGEIVSALDAAGFFRLRGVLVGSAAFQTYPGLLGVILPHASMQTNDLDLAQFHSISVSVEDAVSPPVLKMLQEIDKSFRDVPHQIHGNRSSKFINAKRFAVEFLTPNRGSDDHQGKPSIMPALGGGAPTTDATEDTGGSATAQPLRYLDFLIHRPVRAVLLHGSGVGVTVPVPERYAVHKLIVAAMRRDGTDVLAKRHKDILQAELLIEALMQRRLHEDLRDAFREAVHRGPSWRAAIRRGLSMTSRETHERVKEMASLDEPEPDSPRKESGGYEF